MIPAIKINGAKRCPDWGCYVKGDAKEYPYIIFEMAYANQSLVHLKEQMLMYVSAPCHIMVAIGVKLFKPWKDGTKRVVVSSPTYIFRVVMLWIQRSPCLFM